MEAELEKKLSEALAERGKPISPQKGGLLLNYPGIIDHPLRLFMTMGDLTPPRIKPSVSLSIEASALANKLATRFGLKGLVETHFFPPQSADLQIRAEAAIDSGEIELLAVIDCLPSIQISIKEKRDKTPLLPSIAISGLGLVSSYGQGVDSFSQGVFSGKPASSEPLFRIPNHLKNLAFQQTIQEAIESAGYTLETFPFDRTILISITKAGPVPTDLQQKAPDWLSNRAEWVPHSSSFRSIFQVSAACASVGFAVRLGRDLLYTNRCQLILICGMELASQYEILGMQALKSLSPGMPKPFDQERRGIQVGEGGGALILEHPEHLKNREHHPLSWVKKVGTYVSYSAPAVTDVEGLAQAMLHSIGSTPIAEVGAIHAHATGTQEGDQAEAEAIRMIFGAEIPPVFSHKGAIGHLLYSSGFFSVGSAILALQKQTLFPTIGCQIADPQLGIDVVYGVSRKGPLSSILVNGAGFFGNFSGLLLTETA